MQGPSPACGTPSDLRPRPFPRARTPGPEKRLALHNSARGHKLRWLIRCCRVLLCDDSSLSWERGHPARNPRAGETPALPGTGKRSTAWYVSKGKVLFSCLPGRLVHLSARDPATRYEPLRFLTSPPALRDRVGGQGTMSAVCGRVQYNHGDSVFQWGWGRALRAPPDRAMGGPRRPGGCAAPGGKSRCTKQVSHGS